MLPSSFALTLTYETLGERSTLAGTEPAEADPLGEAVKDCISTVNKLSALGLSTLNVKLPKCVVLGRLPCPCSTAAL